MLWIIVNRGNQLKLLHNTGKDGRKVIDCFFLISARPHVSVGGFGTSDHLQN